MQQQIVTMKLMTISKIFAVLICIKVWQLNIPATFNFIGNLLMKCHPTLLIRCDKRMQFLELIELLDKLFTLCPLIDVIWIKSQLDMVGEFLRSRVCRFYHDSFIFSHLIYENAGGSDSNNNVRVNCVAELLDFF